MYGIIKYAPADGNQNSGKHTIKSDIRTNTLTSLSNVLNVSNELLKCLQNIKFIQIKFLIEFVNIICTDPDEYYMAARKEMISNILFLLHHKGIWLR